MENSEEFKDIGLICKEENCGRKFILKAGEQKWYKEKGFYPPKRCPSCRFKNRQKINNLPR